MASSGSLKGGAMLRSGSLRQVSVRGFENLAQGDSTLFRPEPGSNADVDEAYIAAARAATLKLQMGNAKATAGKPPIRAGPRGRTPFRDASAGRVAGLFDLSPDSARAIMEKNPADNTPPARQTEPSATTPSSVLTPSASAKSETSSEGEVSPEKASAPAQAEPTAEAPAAAAAPAPAPTLPLREYKGEFVKLQDHDQAMGMASLALTAKNIALDAMVTETDTLRDKVDALSPKAGRGEGRAGGAANDGDASSDAPSTSSRDAAGAQLNSSEALGSVGSSAARDAELERMRKEIARLEVALKKEQQACFTLRAERVAWRHKEQEMLEEFDELRAGAASVGRLLGGDAESTAFETLTVLSHALRGEDLSFDAPGTKARCEEIAKAGGVAAVLGAMAAHPSSERVQSAGAEALRRMAESSDAARVALCSAPEKLMGLGGVPVLIRAMSTNPDSPEIAEAAGSVLVAVAKQGDEGEKAVGKEGRAALAEASKNFPEVSYYDWLVSWF
jgi:hypothetical protein